MVPTFRQSTTSLRLSTRHDHSQADGTELLVFFTYWSSTEAFPDIGFRLLEEASGSYSVFEFKHNGIQSHSRNLKRILNCRCLKCGSHFFPEKGWYPCKKCPTCGRSFRAYSSYQKHQALHRGETKCPICLRVFSQKGSMKTHVLLVHNQELYTG